MDALKCMSPCELVVLATLIAFAISDGMDADDLNILGNFVVAVGGLILVWAAQKQTQQNACEKNAPVSLDDLRNEMNILEEKYKAYEKSHANQPRL